ncbi:MAG: cytochrome c [Polyangiaceae bacterium]
MSGRAHLLPFDAFGVVVATIGVLVALPSTGCRDARATGESQVANDEGRTLFAATCARCHGELGRGGLPLYDGGPAPRDFGDHAFQVSRTDDELRETVRKGKSTGMPPFAGALTDAQIDAILKHVRSLDASRTR